MIEHRLPERRAEFVRDRDELLRRVADLNAIIESIDRAIAAQQEDQQGEHPEEPPPPAKDEYITKGTGDAIVSYLTARRTFKVCLAKLEEHLAFGGAQVRDRGNGLEGRLHNIVSSISQLAKQHHSRPPLVKFSKVMNGKNIDRNKSLVWLADTAAYTHPPRNQEKKKKLKD